MARLIMPTRLDRLLWSYGISVSSAMFFWYHRAHLLLIRLHLALRTLKKPGSRLGLSVEVAEHF